MYDIFIYVSSFNVKLVFVSHVLLVVLGNLFILSDKKTVFGVKQGSSQPTDFCVCDRFVSS